ncbi:MAG: endonuclease/exonuclease/phosphatase family protein [Rhodobacteraceae bacterium]|nr:endonuclease/exonuclease/phosphatase family protein [Paracoccaceae bacterium]MCZ8084734.1 endonuclease/exonuclease/phosphatase family protein [Paracoccaceae bacterium]
MERRGPGLLLRDIEAGKDAQIAAILAVLARLDADILVLTGMDHDPGLHALSALALRLQAAGHPYQHLYAPRPNAGQPTGFDVDGDGRLNEPEDAQGWGRFPGAGGTAILSRLPLLTEQAQDFSGLLWRDLPQANLPPDMDPGLAEVQRLSSHSHLILPVLLPGGARLSLLIWHATPPAFDGPQDRNGRRNADEAGFWLHLLNSRLAIPPPAPPFILLGDANLDPNDGDGRPDALRALLNHPALTDPAPRGTHGRTEPAHRGDPALDTAIYTDLGGLRLDYLLPSGDLVIHASGVLWPPDDDPFAAKLATASHHYPVWIDLSVLAATPGP